MADTIYPGNAGQADVLNGKQFSAGTNYNAQGTMPNNGAVTITPSNADQAIPPGYHNGSGKVPAVTFDATKVLTGTTIAGTAGTMPNNGALGTITPSTANQAIPSGYTSGGTVAGDPNLVAANILSGKRIFGVAGSVQSWKSASGTATSSASQININTSYPTGNANYYTVSVTGLSFTAQIIVLTVPSYPAANTVYDASGSFFNQTVQIVDITASKGFNLSNNSGNLSVTSTGFTLPVYYPASAPVDWWAMGY